MELVLATNLLVGFCEKCRIIPFISPIQLVSSSFCFAVSLKNANGGSWLHPFLADTLILPQEAPQSVPQ